MRWLFSPSKAMRLFICCSRVAIWLSNACSTAARTLLSEASMSFTAGASALELVRRLLRARRSRLYSFTCCERALLDIPAGSGMSASMPGLLCRKDFTYLYAESWLANSCPMRPASCTCDIYRLLAAVGSSCRLALLYAEILSSTLPNSCSSRASRSSMKRLVLMERRFLSSTHFSL